MAVDENGKLITGEMTDYRPDEMTLCKNPANGVQALVRMSAETPEQADALRAAGLAVEAPAIPEPSWLEAFGQKVQKSIQDALKPFQNILTSKGSTDPMDPNATPTPEAKADTMISEADWAKIDEKIKALVTEAIDAFKAEKAEGSPAASGEAEKSMPAAAPAAVAAAPAPVAETPAEKSAPSPLEQALTALAQNQQQQGEALKLLMNQRSAGNLVPVGNTPEQADAQKSAWAGSGLTSALSMIPTR